MSEILVAGLRKASPKQDVIFVLEKTEPTLIGLTKDSSFAAGRIFYKDKKLNLILGDYNKARNRGYEAAYDPSNTGIVTYRFDHGSRSKMSKGSEKFTKSVYEFSGVESKSLRPDWFILDLELAPKGYAHREEQARLQGLEIKRKEIEEIFGESFPAMMTTSNQTVIPAPIVLPKSTEDRLVVLNKLKDKGLITEEEYAAKRQKILDEL